MATDTHHRSQFGATNGHSTAPIPSLSAPGVDSGGLSTLTKWRQAGLGVYRQLLSRIGNGRRGSFRFFRENRWVFVVTFLLLLPAWVKGINLLMLLALLVIAMWVVNLWIAGKQIRFLNCRRSWHGPIHAGREAHWDIEVQNHGRRRATGFRVFESGPAHEREWFVDRLDEQQSIRINVNVVLPRRGRYALPPVVVASLYPFGVAMRRRSAGPSDYCVVLPRLGRLHAKKFERWLAQRISGDVQLRRMARPSMLHQDDLHGLRQFRAGDNPRWIHWRTSARRNQKMVREFEQNTGQELIVLVEPYSSKPEQFDPRLESTISLAATICFEWPRLGGDRLQLGVFGSKPIIINRAGGGESAIELLRTLALVEGESSIDAASLMKRISLPTSRTAPIILVTSSVNSPTAARLIKAWNRPVLTISPEMARDFYDDSASPA